METPPQEMPAPARAPAAWIPWLLAVVIAVGPRVARLFSPQVWMEDAASLYHGFSIGAGQQPFLDSINGHPPSIETLLAGLYALFGTSYRVAEITSAVVMIVTALLLYDLGRRLTNRWIGLVGVATFSLSPLLVRYHVYEREVFTVAIATITFWLLARWPGRPATAIGAGLLAVAAAAVKLSGGFLLVPVVVWSFDDLREFRTLKGVQLPRRWPLGEPLPELKQQQLFPTGAEDKTGKGAGGWLDVADDVIWEMQPDSTIPR
ncbi:glycosyltransferase family 39 protein, partial [bacterium]|nr:glycosyltransferase family 39 protein [bacterium]